MTNSIRSITRPIATSLVLLPCTLMALTFHRRYLERAAEDKADKLDKHRFLVQTKAIEDEDYEKIVSATAEQRIDAVRTLQYSTAHIIA